MERKKLLRSGLAILCIISMVLSYFGGLSPESKVEAAETLETLPTTGFTEVTPKDFGIEDFSGNTSAEVKTSSLKPVPSLENVMIRMKVVFGAGSTINLLQFDDYVGSGKKGFCLSRSGSNIRLAYSGGANKFYVDGEDSTVWYWDIKPLSSQMKFDTTEIDLAVTMQLVTYDTSGENNDLKVGIWIDGQLYDNKFVYLTGRTISANSVYMDMNVISCTSPFTTVPTNAQDGYRVVTPATFGIADGPSQEGTSVTGSTATNADGTYNTYDIDKVMLTAKVQCFTNKNGYIQYLFNENGIRQLQFMWSTNYNGLLIYNYFGCGDMYVDGSFDENGNYQQGNIAPISHNSSFEITAASAGYTNKYYLRVYEFLLTVTTDLKDLDNDDMNDDLQMDVYIDGTLCHHFYLLNIQTTVCQERFLVDNMQKITSPMMELDDLGPVGGEYAGDNTDFATSSVATSKVINGTTVQSDVLFTSVGGTLNYGFGGANSEKAVQLTSTADGIQVSYTDGADLQNIVLLNQKKVGIDVVDNAFHLKLTTDVVAADSDATQNDIKLGIQVNNKYSCFYLKDIATTDMAGAKMSIQCEEGATVAFGRFENATPTDIAHCLDDGAYTFESASGVSRVSVDGVGQDAGFAIDEPGEYQLAVTQNRQVTWENVIIYHRYDVNNSHAFDIKDLVRMLKFQDQNMHAQTVAELAPAGKLSIWYENDENWSDMKTELVLDFMRERLVQQEEGRKASVSAIDETQLAQFANRSGAFTSDFTINIDLTEAIDSDLIDVYNENNILTSKAQFVSLNGEYPTIRYYLVSQGQMIFYLSMPYMIGDENKLTTREWRVPNIPSDDYKTLQIEFVIPDGVALYIDELSYRVETEDDLIAIDEEYENEIQFHAHSGFYKYAPANTASSFRMAGEVGFKSLITIPKFTAPTKDNPLGVGVCFHDDATVRHILRYKDDYKQNGSDIIQEGSADDKPIDQFTYEDLQTRFHTGQGKSFYKNEPIATLEEFFDICDDYEMAPVFSVHPALSPEQWDYVKRLLLDQTKDYKTGTQTVYLDGEPVQSTWIYDHFQVKFGALRSENADGYGLEDAVDAFGTTIGGYILIRSASSSTDLYTIAQGVGLVDKTTGKPLDMVSVEFFHVAKNLEDKIALARERGFKTISIAPNSGFSGQEFRRLMALGVNSFTVDYHCSMGLNW